MDAKVHSCADIHVKVGVYLKGVAYGKEPRKHCSVLIDCKQAKHPCHSQKW